MRYLLLALMLLTGCSAAVTTPAGVGAKGSADDQQAQLWAKYYEAKAKQLEPQDLVSIELTEDGKVKKFTVKQAVAPVQIEKPTREVGDLAKVGIAFIEGTRDIVKLALPVAGTVAAIDRVGHYVAKAGEGQSITNTNSYNNSGDTAQDSYKDSSTNGSYNPVDNSNQDNPVDNSNQGNPVDNSNQDNPVDNSNQGNPYYPIDNSNQGNPYYPIDNSNQGNPVDNSNQGNPVDNNYPIDNSVVNNQ